MDKVDPDEFMRWLAAEGFMTLFVDSSWVIDRYASRTRTETVGDISFLATERNGERYIAPLGTPEMAPGTDAYRMWHRRDDFIGRLLASEAQRRAMLEDQYAVDIDDD